MALPLTRYETLTRFVFEPRDKAKEISKAKIMKLTYASVEPIMTTRVTQQVFSIAEITKFIVDCPINLTLHNFDSFQSLIHQTPITGRKEHVFHHHVTTSWS